MILAGRPEGEHRRARRERPPSTRLSIELALAACCLAALAGCATAPPPAAPATAGTAAPEASAEAPPSPAAVFEAKQRERAAASTRQKRLADAAVAWEILTVLRPDVAEYRERLAETQRLIDAAVAERLPGAAQATRRGELDAAGRQYLAILALQPQNEAAAEALRAIERERNKRNYLGKFSRQTLTRRAAAEAEVMASASRNDIEHASLLADDGEYDDAISLLERRMAADRKDEPTRRLLASVYFRKADAIAASDWPGAMAALDKSVRLNPSQAPAVARLKLLKGRLAPPARAPAVK